MEYVFEDYPKSSLARLYEVSYPESMIGHFHYSRGSGKIISLIRGKFDKETSICVFLDLPPGNKQVVGLYKNIADLRATGEFPNLIVMPIVCREFYYIKFIVTTHLVTDRTLIDKCLAFTPSELVVDSCGKPLADNFERMCKLASKFGIKECARVGRLTPEDRDNIYLICDCLCSGDVYDTSTCNKQTLMSKSTSMVSQFPVFPPHSFVDDVVHIKDKDIAGWHRALVDSFNNTSLKMRSMSHKDCYSTVGYMI